MNRNVKYIYQYFYSKVKYQKPFYRKVYHWAIIHLNIDEVK